jgi:hypothetical protein
VEETKFSVPRENQQPSASHWQTLYNWNVVERGAKHHNLNPLLLFSWNIVESGAKNKQIRLMNCIFIYSKLYYDHH